MSAPLRIKWTPCLPGRFLCIENLQYTAGFLGLAHNATLRQFSEAAHKACASSWQEMLQQYTTFEEEHLMYYCFGCVHCAPCILQLLAIVLVIRLMSSLTGTFVDVL